MNATRAPELNNMAEFMEWERNSKKTDSEEKRRRLLSAFLTKAARSMTAGGTKKRDGKTKTRRRRNSLPSLPSSRKTSSRRASAVLSEAEEQHEEEHTKSTDDVSGLDERQSTLSSHDTWYYSSNHVLVNRERVDRKIEPLRRNINLDEIAKELAEKAAKKGKPAKVPKKYSGNILRGESIRDIHHVTMHRDCKERDYILKPAFQEFGMATQRGEDGLLYLCQIFDKKRQEA